MLIRRFEDLKRLEDATSLEFRIFYEEWDRHEHNLDTLRKELELREKEQDRDQALNESERKMLDNIKKQSGMTLLELQMAVERAEEVNRLVEPALKTIAERLAKIRKDKALVLKFFKDSHARVYENRMEELDREQFMNAVKVKYGGADLEKAEELCSLWEGYLRDPSWQPYKVVMEGEKQKEVVDENDDKLKELKTELGENVYEVVTKALSKFIEYDPRDRYPVPILWNSCKKKRAMLKEGIARLFYDCKILNGKRKRN